MKEEALAYACKKDDSARWEVLDFTRKDGTGAHGCRVYFLKTSFVEPVNAPPKGTNHKEMTSEEKIALATRMRKMTDGRQEKRKGRKQILANARCEGRDGEGGAQSQRLVYTGKKLTPSGELVRPGVAGP
jgi:hypothetical protein